VCCWQLLLGAGAIVGVHLAVCIRTLLHRPCGDLFKYLRALLVGELLLRVGAAVSLLFTLCLRNLLH
jgi:hypothetical protein